MRRALQSGGHALKPFPPAAHGLGWVVLWALLSANYLTNFAGIADQSTFVHWQTNGQARVLGGLYADRMGIEKDGVHLGKLWPASKGPADWDGAESAAETYRLFANPDRQETVFFEHYRSQYGLHEVGYSALSRWLGLDTLLELQAIPAMLTAASVLLLFAAFLRMYSAGFAILFLLTMVCAPLVLTMARNLYWSPFLLLLPGLAAAGMQLSRSTRRRLWLLGAVWAAMLLKCLSNYEYITTVTLFACAPPLLGPLFADPERGVPQYRWAAAVFAACVLAFLVAFLIHAGSRGDGLLDGIRSIYMDDIARRTYGDPAAYRGEAAESLRASPLDVLKIYLFDYPGKRTMIVPGKMFLAMIAFCVCGLGARFAIKDMLARRDAWTFVVSFAMPVSWYVLAKGHSYTQTHINFVLWYIGFMPALVYVTLTTFGRLARPVAGYALHLRQSRG
jgi:uncharacterized membrane protein YqaE (UPF0057 family)